MNSKFAFFVEGKTEAFFLEKLIKEYFTRGKLSYDLKSIRGGSSVKKQIVTIRSTSATNPEIFILIYDCGGDQNVKSYILDEYISLFKSGYTQIIGLRDVYPFTPAELPVLRKKLNYGVPQGKGPIKMLMSIMEIEAWFISEHEHYSKIHPNLNAEVIQRTFGIDIKAYNSEQFLNPASTLNEHYGIVNYTYDKSLSSIQRTIDSLDMANLILNSVNQNNSLKELVLLIESIVK